MTVPAVPGPGNVLCIRTSGWAALAIRLGALLAGKPDLVNHVAVVHHVDAGGVVWCIEGKPGGVGWRNASDYLDSRWTIHNAAQPLTIAQRKIICDTMLQLIGTGYDWQAIAEDAASSFGLTLPGWDATWKGTVPGHVVCSSVAAYSYAKAVAPHPAGDRAVEPADWEDWIMTRGWEKP